MAGSRLPGHTDGYTQGVNVDDGTSALMPSPGGGAVGTPTHASTAAGARADANTAQMQAAVVDKDGRLTAARVTWAIASNIERGAMPTVRGIIVHQTGGTTAQSSLNSYKAKGAAGAHFLLDKDGTIYQTASLAQRTWHVGKLKARCLVEQTCSETEIKAFKKFDPSGMHTRESAKAVPARYPSNDDSIGIELVGATLPPAKGGGEAQYEAVTPAQNDSLKWLVAELSRLLGVPMTEVFRHPQVSWKNTTEASTAQWQ